MNTHSTSKRNMKKNIIIGIILTAVVCSIMLMMYLLTDYLNQSKTGSGKQRHKAASTPGQVTGKQQLENTPLVGLGFQRLL